LPRLNDFHILAVAQARNSIVIFVAPGPNFPIALPGGLVILLPILNLLSLPISTVAECAVLFFCAAGGTRKLTLAVLLVH